jgi:hypothetical protein
MNPEDKNLSKLLKQWRDIEPKANFEASVWRRIRRAQTEEPERSSLLELLLRRRLWQPAYAAVAAAVIVSAVIGTSAGVLTSLRATTTARGELQFMSSGTLAGGYARLGTVKAQ